MIKANEEDIFENAVTVETVSAKTKKLSEPTAVIVEFKGRLKSLSKASKMKIIGKQKRGLQAFSQKVEYTNNTVYTK
jgi:hypothetical protein